jgi:hypothetical protein
LDFGFELLVLFLLPSKAMRLMTGFSVTVMVSRPPCMVGRTSWNRPVAKSAFTPSSI